MLPDVTFFYFWDDEYIKETQDPPIIGESQFFRDKINAEWIVLRSILKKYPHIFKEETLSKEMFLATYA